MEFTPRIRQILNIVLEEGRPVPEQEIADRIGVSKRTVQREFDYMEAGARDYGLTLCKKKNAGLFLEGSPEGRERLRRALGAARNTGFTDKEIRRKYLVCELLREQAPRKLYYFSELFGVSEATVSNDLDAVSPWFAANRIAILRRPGYGVALSGTERDYRDALQRFIKENVGDRSIRQLLSKGGDAVAEAVECFDGRNIYDLLNSEILGKVSRTLQEMEDPRLQRMADSSFIGLILHITIAIDRILKGETIETAEEADAVSCRAESGGTGAGIGAGGGGAGNGGNRASDVAADEDEILAQRIISRLGEEFGLDIPEGETAYVLLHIKGSKVAYSGRESRERIIGTERMLDIADRMIDAFGGMVTYDLKCDEEFLHGLLMHMEPAMIRLKHGMGIYNPLLEEIKEEYRDVFERCRRAAAVLGEAAGKEVPEDEIGYLAMHFGAALAKAADRREMRRSVEIGVVCASGFGLARLMMMKLKNCLKRDASFHTYGKDEITPYVRGRIDFFVSSFDLEDLEIDYVKVSPLISGKDQALIRRKVEEYAHMPPKKQDSDFNRQLDVINQTAAEIKNLVRKYRNYRLPAEIGLDDMLGALARHGAEEPASAAVLKASLLEREKIMSQVFPEMEFALFHCRSRAVDETICYSATPEEGEHFTDRDLKGIRAAVVLLMPQESESGQEAEILGHISSAFVEDGAFLPLIFSGEEEKVRKRLEKILKSYFNEYIGRL